MRRVEEARVPCLLLLPVAADSPSLVEDVPVYVQVDVGWVSGCGGCVGVSLHTSAWKLF